ncbi:hypothetical protein [Streptomyces sp. V4I2]|uniref:hypothetical protein n=1 Tax=Streptomyces sp. V4I2 TaxID=3042280 RepID=UPI0027848BFF|nr:hypothetical protein [Streptomyces sp. V4I2]MDQ1051112.1 hypothetical protein [Streptomyces sp. V4I2]
MSAYAVVFLILILILILVAVWCFAGRFFATRPIIAEAFSRWGHILLPLVLTAMGLKWARALFHGPTVGDRVRLACGVRQRSQDGAVPGTAIPRREKSLPDPESLRAGLGRNRGLRGAVEQWPGGEESGTASTSVGD